MTGPALGRAIQVTVGGLFLLVLALLLLPSAIQAAPYISDLQATLQTAQFEMHALDGVPWYFCH